jgi:hypothetical protein
MRPGTLSAAGPGRFTWLSMSELPLDGTQNTDASVAGCGMIADRAASGACPVSVIDRHGASPKQPAVV